MTLIALAPFFRTARPQQKVSRTVSQECEGPSVSGMVERAARALCAREGSAPEDWRRHVPTVETVLEATMLPAIPVAQGQRPEAHPELNDWAHYRKLYGEAGARAREPDLRKVSGWYVLAAWRTWNGMVSAALGRTEAPVEAVSASSIFAERGRQPIDPTSSGH
jgi:hypothetical protein